MAAKAAPKLAAVVVQRDAYDDALHLVMLAAIARRVHPNLMGSRTSSCVSALYSEVLCAHLTQPPSLALSPQCQLACGPMHPPAYR